jgi:hypothetical protein
MARVSLLVSRLGLVATTLPVAVVKGWMVLLDLEMVFALVLT